MYVASAPRRRGGSSNLLNPNFFAAKCIRHVGGFRTHTPSSRDTESVMPKYRHTSYYWRTDYHCYNHSPGTSYSTGAATTTTADQPPPVGIIKVFGAWATGCYTGVLETAVGLSGKQLHDGWSQRKVTYFGGAAHQPNVRHHSVLRKHSQDTVLHSTIYRTYGMRRYRNKS